MNEVDDAKVNEIVSTGEGTGGEGRVRGSTSVYPGQERNEGQAHAITTSQTMTNSFMTPNEQESIDESDSPQN